MKYTVVHSNDPWLLARLATDLQMEGCNQVSINTKDPFMECVEWFTIYNDGEFGFYIHECASSSAELRCELTEENYITVLNQILNP